MLALGFDGKCKLESFIEHLDADQMQSRTALDNLRAAASSNALQF